jgi:hypothetical protein
MPEDRTPRKISLTEPTDADEDPRPRSRRKDEAKEANRVFPRQKSGASSAETADTPAEYGDAAQRRLV